MSIRPVRYIGFLLTFLLIASLSHPISQVSAQQVTAKNALDAQFYFQLIDGNPLFNFDANDFFLFDRANNRGSFSVDGTTKLAITNVGVGIGTLQPSQKLEVLGSSWFPLIVGTTNSGGGGIAVHPNDFNKRVELSVTGEGNGRIYLPSVGNVATFQNTSGNVGVSVDDPTQKLDVNGQIRIRGGSPGTGKVLTSDENGVGTWQTPSSGNSVRVINFQDDRAGCPPAAVANATLMQQVFTTSTASTPVTINTTGISFMAGNRYIYLYVNGNLVAIDLLSTSALQWMGFSIYWGGNLGSGTHTIQVSSDQPNHVGCGGYFGRITTTIYGPP